MQRALRLVCLALAAAALSAQTPLYQNPNAPVEARVQDLLSRMTLEEKISQLMNDSAAIPRLSVPAYNWWNECLHGVARAGKATVFPETIGLAATWDKDLIFRAATAISDEARAKNNEFVRLGKRGIYQGLTFWTPNINLFRDPRWGRGMETYGEDPYLTARLAVQFIKGLQGDDPKYFKTIATAKHYAVHSGPESQRHTFDAVIDDADLRDTYLPQFEAAVREGNAQSVMCAYNSVDGAPACANTRLLDDILRKEWGFSGYVVSDCGAIGDIYLHHKYAPTAELGVAKAIRAGTDLNCGVEYEALLPAVKQGALKEAEIDRSLGRLLTARFRLGMFDPPSMVKYTQISPSVNDSPAHRALALEAARKAMVLLKNEGNALPLSKSLRTVAVIGPDANDVDALTGNYNGDPSEPVTALEGIRRKLTGARVIYARGSDLAAHMPNFETVPASALFTSNAADSRSGLAGEYYNTANFDGQQHRPRELTYPGSGKMTGNVPRNPKPVFTRSDLQIDFHWHDGAPRTDMNDDDFGVRWTGYLEAPVTGTYQLGAIGLNAFELYLDGKRIVSFNNIHEKSYQYEQVELEAHRRYAIRLDYHEFLNDADITLVWSKPADAKALWQETEDAVRAAERVILVLGLSPRLEGEEMKVPVEGFSGGDRVSLDIPRAQEELLERVVALGKPVTLVLMNGSAVSVNWAREHVPSIVEAWYPGEAGGDAIADVLFGDYNPGGRLPVTFYKSAEQLPPFTDYSMKERTYRYFTGEPLFPFGYGLSYTTFAYRNLRAPAEVNTGDPVTVSVEVANTGKRAGEEVVQLYLTPPARAGAPLRSLEGFERVALAPGQRKTVSFRLEPRQFAGQAGTFDVVVGGSKASVRLNGAGKDIH